jgi:hypothetical protein
MKDATIEDRQASVRVSRMLGTYDGAELRPDPGIPASRMEAYRLPSRNGDRLEWPDGRVTDLDWVDL